jgi:hypothetical protein
VTEYADVYRIEHDGEVSVVFGYHTAARLAIHRTPKLRAAYERLGILEAKVTELVYRIANLTPPGQSMWICPLTTRQVKITRI